MKVFSHIRNRYYESTPPEERFWPRVRKTESCWLWMGAKTKSGYGKFNSTSPGWEKAHRFSWRLHFGEIPQGKVVCHTCNIKICVRPDHLYVATSRQNSLDALRDGLSPIGEKHGMAKLTDQEIIEIRLSYAPRKVSMGFLAHKYGITKTQIRRIIKHQSWKHLT